MTVGQFFVDQIRDCRVHVWPIGRQRDKLVDRYSYQSVISKILKYRKYRTQMKYRKVQESYKNTGIYRIYRTAGITDPVSPAAVSVNRRGYTFAINDNTFEQSCC